MRHGTTIKNLCIRFKVGKAIKLNIYRLVQFLCVHGIIRRIHKVTSAMVMVSNSKLLLCN